MDALVDFLNGPRARGAFLVRSIMEPPWSLRIQDQAPLTVVAMVHGTAWVLPDGGDHQTLGAGDVAIIRGPGPYTVADDPMTPPDVVIPPRASAVLNADAVDPRSQRDRHIQLIAEKGRMGWQRATGYGRRSLVETAIGRYKHLIGSKLRARSLTAQQGEVAIAVKALNRMIRVAKPLSVRVT